nr:hypothetical protein [Protofrankia symbiont of Coriaria ruscifolia]
MFTAAPEFTVLCGRDEIGRTDPVLLTDPVEGPRLLSDDVRWWTWAGERANLTLVATLGDLADGRQRADAAHVRLPRSGTGWVPRMCTSRRHGGTGSGTGSRPGAAWGRV